MGMVIPEQQEKRMIPLDDTQLKTELDDIMQRIDRILENLEQLPGGLTGNGAGG